MNRQIKQDIASTRNWIILISLFGLVVLLGYSIVNTIDKVRTSSENRRVSEQEYQELYDRSVSIEETLQNFENDFGFEKYVRENFGVAKPGEHVVIIVDTRKE